jgi:hypothetical protein
MNFNALFDALLLLSFMFLFYFEETELWCGQFMIEVGSYIWVGGAPEDKRIRPSGHKKGPPGHF